MSAVSTKGMGSKLYQNSVAIGGIMELDFPGFESDKHEVTNLDSEWREYAPGMVDGGDLTFEVLYVPQTYSDIIGWLSFVRVWTVETPDGLTGSFDGFVTK